MDFAEKDFVEKDFTEMDFAEMDLADKTSARMNPAGKIPIRFAIRRIENLLHFGPFLAIFLFLYTCVAVQPSRRR
jgi:hypothetical protein